MPLPVGVLGEEDIHAIFGSEMDVETGNYILSIMHYRRLSGQLIDAGVSFPKDSGVTREQAIQGLEYVRQMEPDINEEENGNIWAEEETKRIEAEMLERAQNLGIYKREPVEAEEEEQGTEEGRQRTGESMLIRQRTEKEAEWEAEEAERLIQRDRQAVSDIKSQRGPLELSGGVQPSLQLMTTETGGIAIRPPPTKAWLAPVERKPWVKYYEDQATIIKSQTVPQMSLLRRLGPSLLVAIATIGGALYLSENYTAPSHSARLFPDYSRAVATTGALTTLLLTAFIAARMPPFWRLLSKYFTIVPAYPYAISILGASLRHEKAKHLAPIIAVLWASGLTLHQDVGRGGFVAVLLASAAVGGFASLSWQVYQKAWSSYIYGASSAVLGVLAAACALHPWGRIEIAGLEVPLTAWMFLGTYAGLQVYALVKGKGPARNTDYAGHVGGLATGLASAYYLGRKDRGKDVLMKRTEAKDEDIAQILAFAETEQGETQDEPQLAMTAAAARREGGGGALWRNN
ncbi:hypothetical protein MBLNU230_g1069t1 [Neophaeotheca triangularis]